MPAERLRPNPGTAAVHEGIRDSSAVTDSVVEAHSLSKRFVLRHNRSASLKVRVLGVLHRAHREVLEDFWALRDVSLKIGRGDSVGLVGRNGSGKSTFLKLIAGIHRPTRGRLLISPVARIGTMIELGVGFHPDLSGTENVFLNAAIHGLNRADIEAIYPGIVEYSGLEHFMDVPLKNYSSGMHMRLGFAIAANLNPDILLLDEIFAVGDADFQKQCMKTMDLFAEQGRTLVFVSHAAASVQAICRRVCLLDHGRLMFDGTAEAGLAEYQRLLALTPAAPTLDAAGARTAAESSTPPAPDDVHEGQPRGDWQLDFLRREGLKPHHRVLEIGCGSAGVSDAIVRFVGADRYEQWQYGSPQSRPLHSFDFALASPLFSRLSLNAIGPVIASVVRTMSPGARLYATWFDGPDPASLEPQVLPNGVVTFSDAEPYHYAFEVLAGLSTALGATASRVSDTTHPGGESVLVLVKHWSGVTLTRLSRALRHPLRTLRRIADRARSRRGGPEDHSADARTAAYRRWAQRHEPDTARLARLTEEAATFPYRPLVSIITPVYNTDPAWLRACVDSVQRQVYANWQLCLSDDGSTSPDTLAVLDEQTDPRITVTHLERNSGISAASNAALSSARGEFVALLDHDDELTPDALCEMVRRLNASPDADIVYSDEDKRDADGRLSEPFFKPDWSPEHLLSAMYTCHLTVVRKTLVDRVGGFRTGYEGAQDYDLMLRASERTTGIEHVPKILYHWRRAPGSTAAAGSAKPWADDAGKRALDDYVRRNRVDADVMSGGVPGLYRVKFAIRGGPLVTIVVTEDERVPTAIDRCVTAIREQTAYPRYEVLPVRGPAAALTRQVNAAIRASGGTHVVLLDAALRPSHDEWLGALLEYSQQDPVGAVGARIDYADGRLRHIGVVTCTDGGPAAVLHGHAGTTYGHFSSAIGVRNYSAVSGECLMTRRSVFDRLGGLDERLGMTGADVDYCLRVRRDGFRVVFTPYARLRRVDDADRTGPDPGGAAAIRAIWGSTLGDDPYYNPNLSRASPDYMLDG